ATLLFGLFLPTMSVSELPSAPPQPTPAKVQGDVELDQLLSNYDKKRSKIKDFRITFTQTREDRAFRTRSVYRGEARGPGADLLRITQHRDNIDEKTTILFNGKRITFYDYNEKTKRIFDPSSAQDDLTLVPLNWIAGIFDEPRLVFAGKPSNVL